jgi:hypothetical protein
VSQAGTPFEFIGCIELFESLGRRAQDERELIELLQDVPPGSVFYHVYGYFLRHRFFVGPYANDFARWVLLQVRDPLLGERLAVVDPFEFADLEQLREELISIIDDHLSRLPVVPRVDYGEPFYFAQSHTIAVPTGRRAETLTEFRDGLAEIEASAVYFHMVEARARRGRRSGDFAEWLRSSLGRTALAEKVERMDLYLSSLERARAQILSLVDAAIDEPEAEPGPAAPARA